MEVARPAPGRPTADVAIRRLLFAGAALTPFNYWLALPLGDVTIHPLQVWGAVLVFVTLLLRPRAFLEAADAPVLLLWTTFVFVLMSTLVGTPEEYRLRGYLDVCLLAINLAACTLTYGWLRRDPASWAPFARTLFAASIVSSGLLVVRALQVAEGGVFVHPDSYVLGLGTVTGTFTAAFAAASVLALTFARGARTHALLIAGVVAHGMAASLSLARGPWLALAIAVAAGFALTIRTLRSPVAVVAAALRGAGAAVLLLSAMVGVTVINAQVTRFFASRVVQLASVSSGTGLQRLNLFGALLDDAMDSPLFGHGAATYRRVSELLGRQISVSENFLLEMFHAGGAMAALPLVLAASLIVARGTRSLAAPMQTAVAAACLSGIIALMLGALTNPAAWDTAFWVLLGTAGAFRALGLPRGVAGGPARTMASP